MGSFFIWVDIEWGFGMRNLALAAVLVGGLAACGRPADSGQMAAAPIAPAEQTRPKALVETKAASVPAIIRLVGAIAQDNSASFANTISENEDKIIGIKVSVEPGETDGYLVNKGDDYLGITAGEFELVVQSGYRWEHGGYVVDGFYLVKGGGMHQGIISYGLEPVDEGTLRANPSVRIVDKNF